MTSRAVTRFSLILAAAVTPLALESTGFLYTSKVKELFLLLTAAACLTTLDAKSAVIWAGTTIALAGLTLPTPEAGAAHTWLVMFSSITAIALAARIHTTRADLIPVMRATAVATIILGIDSLSAAFGKPLLLDGYSTLFGGTLREDSFPIFGESHVPRAFSFLGNPNHLGAYGAIAAAMLVGARSSDTPWNRVHLVAITSSLCVVALSFSRSAWAASAAGALVAVMFFHRRRRIPAKALIGPAVALAAILLMLSPWIQSLYDSHFTIHDQRMRIWSGAMSAFLERPFTGWGLGAFGEAFSRHAPVLWWNPITLQRSTLDAHSEPLTIAVELGIPGLVTSGAAALMIAGKIRPRISSCGETSDAWFSLALAVAFLMALFSHILRQPPILLLVAIALLRIFAPRVETAHMDCDSQWPWRRVIPAGLLVIVTMPVFIADSYSRYAFAAQSTSQENSLLWSEQAYQLRPADPTSRFLRGFLHLPRTLPDLVRLSEEYPGYRDIEYSLATLLDRAGHDKVAKELYRRSCDLRPMERCSRNPNL